MPLKGHQSGWLLRLPPRLTVSVTIDHLKGSIGTASGDDSRICHLAACLFHKQSTCRNIPERRRRTFRDPTLVCKLFFAPGYVTVQLPSRVFLERHADSLSEKQKASAELGMEKSISHDPSRVVNTADTNPDYCSKRTAMIQTRFRSHSYSDKQAQGFKTVVEPSIARVSEPSREETGLAGKNRSSVPSQDPEIQLWSQGADMYDRRGPCDQSRHLTFTFSE